MKVYVNDKELDKNTILNFGDLIIFENKPNMSMKVSGREDEGYFLIPLDYRKYKDSYSVKDILLTKIRSWSELYGHLGIEISNKGGYWPLSKKEDLLKVLLWLKEEGIARSTITLEEAVKKFCSGLCMMDCEGCPIKEYMED